MTDQTQPAITLEEFYSKLEDTRDEFIWAVHPQNGLLRSVKRAETGRYVGPNTYCPISAVVDYYPAHRHPESYAVSWLGMDEEDAIKIALAADNRKLGDYVVRERLLLATQPLMMV